MINRKVLISIVAVMGLVIVVTVGALLTSSLQQKETVSYRDPNTGTPVDGAIIDKPAETNGQPLYTQGLSILNSDVITEKLPSEQIDAIRQKLAALLWQKTGRTDHTAQIVQTNDSGSELTIVVLNPRSVYKVTSEPSSYTATGDVAVGTVTVEQIIDKEQRYE